MPNLRQAIGIQFVPTVVPAPFRPLFTILRLTMVELAPTVGTKSIKE